VSRRKKPHEVAYAEARADLEQVLTRAGAADPAQEAVDYLRRLLNAGWRHTRPDLEPEPPAGPNVRAEEATAYLAAKAALTRKGDRL